MKIFLIAYFAGVLLTILSVNLVILNRIERQLSNGYSRVYEDGSYIKTNGDTGCFEWGLCND